jgi:hypothetical protein
VTQLETLAPDQRAVLELLLRRGRSYSELSGLLGIPEAGVRTRAHAALEALAGDRPAPQGEDGAVADWLLGQQDEPEARRTRDAIAGIPTWRAWAAEVAGRLGEVEGASVPEVPEAADDDAPTGRTRPSKRPAAAAAGEGGATRAPARRPRPLRDGAAPERRPRPIPAGEPAAAAAGGTGLPLRSSRLGGALLIGVLALLIGGALFLLLRGGDDGEPPASQPAASPTATATPQVVSEVVLQGAGNKAQGLMRVFRRDEDGKLVFALAADNVPANRAREVYAVWFTKQGAAPRNLGFSQAQVGKEGVFTTGGPQQGQEEEFARLLGEYEQVIVARANADSANARRPGEVVLRGTLPGGRE